MNKKELLEELIHTIDIVKVLENKIRNLDIESKQLYPDVKIVEGNNDVPYKSDFTSDSDISAFLANYNIPEEDWNIHNNWFALYCAIEDLRELTSKSGEDAFLSIREKINKS